MPVFFHFNYDAVPSLKSLNLSTAILYHFGAETLHYSVILTSDPMTFNICNMLLCCGQSLYQI